MLIVPDPITEELQSAVRANFDGQEAILIPVRPRPRSMPLNCGPNVRAAIAAGGGAYEKGWRLWWVPGLWIEAQAHVVWRDPKGALVDVTPNQDRETTAAFIVDPSIAGDPRTDFIPSRTIKISQDPAVEEFLANAPVLAEYHDLAKTGRLSERESPKAVALEKRQILLVGKLKSMVGHQ
jgi:hypothetical protein